MAFITETFEGLIPSVLHTAFTWPSNKVKVFLICILSLLVLFELFTCVQAASKVQFFEDSHYNDLLYQSSTVSGCRSLPKQFWNRTSSVKTHDACVVVYGKPSCQDNGWRIEPETGVAWAEFNKRISSYRACEETVTFYSNKFHEGNNYTLSLTSACTNLASSPGSIKNDACVKIYSTGDCTGEPVTLPGGVTSGSDRLEMEAKSFSVCDAISLKWRLNSKDIITERVPSECRTLQSDENQYWYAKADKCVIVFNSKNCQGKSTKLTPAPGSENFTDVDFRINSYLPCEASIDVYRGRNYTGSFTRYQISSGCKSFQSDDRKVISSIDNSGVCITLFSETGCRGRLLEVYPGKGDNLGLLDKEAVSFHRCQLIRFYTGLNHDGLLHVGTINHECKTLPDVFWNQTGSVKLDEVNSACVMVFSLPGCRGYSRRIRPGEGTSVSSHIENVVSFVRCKPKIYAFDKATGAMSEVGSVETRCKKAALPHSGDKVLVAADACTKFYETADCRGGNPFRLDAGTEDAFLSPSYRWFRSCKKTIKFLDTTSSLGDILYEDTLSEGGCTNLSDSVWNRAHYVETDECVTLYSRVNCQGQSVEFESGSMSSLSALRSRGRSYGACSPKLKLYKNEEYKRASFENSITLNCIPIKEELWSPDEVVVTNGCVRIYEEPECRGLFESFSQHNSTVAVGMYILARSFASCDFNPKLHTEKTEDVMHSLIKLDSVPSLNTGDKNVTTAGEPEITEAEREFQKYVILGVLFTVLLLVIVLYGWIRGNPFRRPSEYPEPRNIVVRRREAGYRHPVPKVRSSRSPMKPLVYGGGKTGDVFLHEYSAEDVELLYEIGRGNFGKVFKAHINGYFVAVKEALHGNSSIAEQELKIMLSFSHPHIVRLEGIVRLSGSRFPSLIFEYMDNGNLAELLKVNSPRNSAVLKTTVSRHGSRSNVMNMNWSHQPEVHRDYRQPSIMLTLDSLQDIARQLAEGMKYLSCRRFIHRDLAARNCLVSATGIVKIADFGLTRNMYTIEYYKADLSQKLPVRWMSPESIRYGRYTLKSDVWAFGILLWEIYSWGKLPYYGYSNSEAAAFIENGIPPDPWPECPVLIQEIMDNCFQLLDRERPSFLIICDRLHKANSSCPDYDFVEARTAASSSHFPSVLYQKLKTGVHNMSLSSRPGRYSSDRY